MSIVGHDERLSLVEHLDELRSRIFHAAIALAVGMVLAAVFNGLVFRLLLAPLKTAVEKAGLPENAAKITTFSPTEPFMISLKIWAYAGVILAAPVFIYEFWAFVAPAIAPTQRRYIYPVVAACSGLFLFGVGFGYLLVLPKGLQWLLSANSGYFNVQNRASDYFSFAAWFLVAFGAVFELPIITILLVRVGVVETRWLRRNRKYALLVLAVLAMVATPGGDPFSMLAMLGALFPMYEISIWVGRIFERRRAAAPTGAGNEGDHDEGPPDGGDLTRARA